MSRVRLDDQISPAERLSGTVANEPSRLVVVSSRVPDPADSESCGGVAVALADLLGARGGLWFGWNGDVVNRAAAWTVPLRRVGGVDVAGHCLTDEERQGYDRTFADGCLRSALHCRLGLMRYCPQAQARYWAVNRRIAAALRPLLRHGDRVTVHDFHLMPLAEALRSQGWRGPTGFFLHAPFPSPEVFASVPGHLQLGRALMANDLVGFQSSGDRRNFSAYMDRYIGRRSDEPLVDTFPMGIDVEAVREAAGRSSGEGPGRFDAQQLSTIVAVDALYHSKGIPERLRAFERLLERHPRHRGRVRLVQIVHPGSGTTEQEPLLRTVERLVGRINGRFGTMNWTPVHSLHRHVPRRQVMALLRQASVGLVTPLRDGMNLVAKEFVAAQDRRDPGVLVLSRLAGAAEDLRAALLVNPTDTDALAQMLDRALDMPLEERRSRHRWLFTQVARTDIAHWRANFLQALNSVTDRKYTRASPAMAGAA